MALTEVCSHVNLFTFRHYTGGHERYARFPLVLSKPSSLVIDSYVGATFPYNWLLRQLYKSFVHHFVLVSYETSCVLYCVSTQKYKKYIYKSCFQPCVKRERERERERRERKNSNKQNEMFWNVLYLSREMHKLHVFVSMRVCRYGSKIAEPNADNSKSNNSNNRTKLQDPRSLREILAIIRLLEKVLR